jgi:two-component system nitrogen regulation sensor histidine kinase GlnL
LAEAFNELFDALMLPALLVQASGSIVRSNPAVQALAGIKRLSGMPIAELLGTEFSELPNRVDRDGGMLELKRHRFELCERTLVADIELTRLALVGPARVLVQLKLRDAPEGPWHSGLMRALAHELRNPLGGMSGAIELIESAPLDRRERGYLTVLKDEIARLKRLLDNLASSVAPAPAAANIHRVCETALAIAQSEFQQVKWLRDYDPSLPDWLLVADRIQQLLLNLLRNAAQAGARLVTVRTRLMRQVSIGPRSFRKALLVEVEDNGEGIPAELSERLFAPFVSTKAHGQGLGLAIAQNIAVDHQGSLNVRSHPGHTVFGLTLPWLL